MSDFLNDAVLERQGALCLIPGCSDVWTDKAHVEPSGMGGRPSLSNPWNLVGLCRLHHDQFDGHRLQGRQRLLRVLMRAVADMVAKERTSL